MKKKISWLVVLSCFLTILLSNCLSEPPVAFTPEELRAKNTDSNRLITFFVDPVTASIYKTYSIRIYITSNQNDINRNEDVKAKDKMESIRMRYDRDGRSMAAFSIPSEITKMKVEMLISYHDINSTPSSLSIISRSNPIYKTITLDPNEKEQYYVIVLDNSSYVKEERLSTHFPNPTVVKIADNNKINELFKKTNYYSDSKPTQPGFIEKKY